MGNFGGFYKGDKKKPKKSTLEKKGERLTNAVGGFVLPKVEIISKGKKETDQ